MNVKNIYYAEAWRNFKLNFKIVKIYDFQSRILDFQKNILKKHSTLKHSEYSHISYFLCILDQRLHSKKL